MTTDLTAAELDALEAMLAKANEKGLSAREMQDSGRAIVYALLDAAPALLRAARREQKMREALAEFVRINDEDSIGLQCASGSDLVLALDAAREALKETP